MNFVFRWDALTQDMHSLHCTKNTFTHRSKTNQQNNHKTACIYPYFLLEEDMVGVINMKFLSFFFSFEKGAFIGSILPGPK